LSEKYNKLFHSKLTKKNTFDYYINAPLNDLDLEGHRESRTEYHKRYINYIAGLKCYTISLSTNIGMGLGNRLNSITCPYYNKDGEEMAIMVHYDFIFTTGGTVLEGSKQSSTKNYTLQQ
ncbi:hypothetical protein, partial [Campylobacter pinnipediorum]